jgi:hypothetical protein
MRNALALLMWLRIRGWARRIGKSARTTRGKVFFGIGLVIIGLWLTGLIVGQRVENRAKKTASTDTVPLLMCAVTLFICVSSGGKQLSFTPAEIDFLFPGPFTRKRLLLYRLSAAALSTLITALFFSFWKGQYAASFLAAFIALYAMLLFATLVSILVTLVRKAVGDPRATPVLRVGGRVFVLACVVGIIDMLRVVRSLDTPFSMSSLVHVAQNTIFGQVILAPFNVLTNVFTAAQVWPDLLLWAGIALGMILLLLLLVLRLDAYFIESSLDASRLVATKRARIKGGNLFSHARGGTVTRSLPMLPRLGGAGVIGWRQLTNAMRNFRGVLIFLVIMLVSGGPALWGMRGTGGDAGQHVRVATIVGTLVPWLLFFLPMMLRFDFRSDIDQMDVLKSLPLTPLAICTGQIMAPSVVLMLVIGMLLSIVALVSPAVLPFLLMAFPFVPVLAALMFAIENMVFLLAPVRMAAASPGDIHGMGRNVVIVLIKFGILFLTAGAAALFGGLSYLLVHGIEMAISIERGISLIAMAIVVWFTLVAAVYLLLRITARLFARYDPSIHAPA